MMKHGREGPIASAPPQPTGPIVIDITLDEIPATRWRVKSDSNAQPEVRRATADDLMDVDILISGPQEGLSDWLVRAESPPLNSLQLRFPSSSQPSVSYNEYLWRRDLSDAAGHIADECEAAVVFNVVDAPFGRKELGLRVGPARTLALTDASRVGVDNPSRWPDLRYAEVLEFLHLENSRVGAQIIAAGDFNSIEDTFRVSMIKGFLHLGTVDHAEMAWRVDVASRLRCVARDLASEDLRRSLADALS